MISGIVRKLESSGESEITSETIGEMVMAALHHLDSVAYVRYASVYKDFTEASDFADFIEESEKAPKRS
jgi:transcriptional repressor NrdR